MSMWLLRTFMINTRAMPTQQTAITGVSRRITAGQEIKAGLCRDPELLPRRASGIMRQRSGLSLLTARQQICRAALLATTVIRTSGIARERDCSADGKPHDSGTLSPEQDLQAKKRYPWVMQDSCI